jgi:hypothetical protein
MERDSNPQYGLPVYALQTCAYHPLNLGDSCSARNKSIGRRAVYGQPSENAYIVLLPYVADTTLG